MLKLMDHLITTPALLSAMQECSRRFCPGMMMSEFVTAIEMSRGFGQENVPRSQIVFWFIYRTSHPRPTKLLSSIQCHLCQRQTQRRCTRPVIQPMSQVPSTHPIDMKKPHTNHSKICSNSSTCSLKKVSGGIGLAPTKLVHLGPTLQAGLCRLISGVII